MDVTVKYSPAHAGRLLVAAQQASRDACPDDGLVVARRLTRAEAEQDGRDWETYRRHLTADAWCVQVLNRSGLPAQYGGAR